MCKSESCKCSLCFRDLLHVFVFSRACLDLGHRSFILRCVVGPPAVAFHVFTPLIMFFPQATGFTVYRTPPEQLLTRSLQSGSSASFLGGSESAGGSCGPSKYSRPYVLCSATDAASAAMDYSTKKNEEDGVVNSPPDRGPVRTPVRSPSPLKRSSPVRCRSLSPTPRTESTPHRKLYGGPDGGVGDPRLDDDEAPPVRPPAPGPTVSGPARSGGSRKRPAPLPSLKPAQCPRIEDNLRPAPLRSSKPAQCPRIEDNNRPAPLRSSKRSQCPRIEDNLRPAPLRPPRSGASSGSAGPVRSPVVQCCVMLVGPRTQDPWVSAIRTYAPQTE